MTQSSLRSPTPIRHSAQASVAALAVAALLFVSLAPFAHAETLEVDLGEPTEDVAICEAASSVQSEHFERMPSSTICRTETSATRSAFDQVVGLKSTIMPELPRPAPRPQAQPQTVRPAADRGEAQMGPPGRRAKRFSRSCSRLMNPQTGELGAWGQSVASILREPKYFAAFTGDGSLGRFCPRFAELSQAQRIRAWVWFWTVLANEESSCDRDLYHPTHYPDGRILNPNEAHGLWAVELRASVRRSNGRGPACNEISSVEGQARCAIDMAYALQLRRGRPISTKYTRQYWGPINRQERQILPNMQRYTPCF